MAAYQVLPVCAFVAQMLRLHLLQKGLSMLFGMNRSSAALLCLLSLRPILRAADSSSQEAECPVIAIARHMDGSTASDMNGITDANLGSSSKNTRVESPQQETGKSNETALLGNWYSLPVLALLLALLCIVGVTYPAWRYYRDEML